MRTIRRLANVPQRKALEEFTAAYPELSVIFPFPVEDREGQKIYVARVVESEFPFGKDDGGSDDGDDKPEPKSERSDDGGDSDSGGDSGGDSKPKPKSKGDSKGGDHEILHLLHQIAQALGIPTADALGGGDMVPPPDNLDVPDVGAPPQGDTLPPPAKPHGGLGGPGAFASVKESQLPDRFAAVTENAAKLSLEDAVKEANATFTTHRVAKINKVRGKFNGQEQIMVVAQMHRK